MIAMENDNTEAANFLIQNGYIRDDERGKLEPIIEQIKSSMEAAKRVEYLYNILVNEVPRTHRVDI